MPSIYGSVGGKPMGMGAAILFRSQPQRTPLPVPEAVGTRAQHHQHRSELRLIEGPQHSHPCICVYSRKEVLGHRSYRTEAQLFGSSFLFFIFLIEKIAHLFFFFFSCFQCNSADEEAKLETMIGKIKEHPFCSVYENYSCEYAGVDENGRVLVKDLGEFGDAVLEDLWEAIQIEFPAAAIKPSVLEQERRIHQKFIVRKNPTNTFFTF
jgi:hypothetical protein